MTHRNRILPAATFILVMIFLAAACSNDDPADPVGDDTGTTDSDYSDWSEATHGNGVDPDYDTVFAQDVVQRLDIEIEAAQWQAMLADMTERYGPLGTGGGRPFEGDENPIWVPCSVFHEGTEWYEVGVRFKGNSSLQSSWSRGIMKLPLKLDFDQYEDDYPTLKNQRFHGFKQLSLSNGFDDASLVREKVTADIFRAAGVAAPQTAFYRVYVDHGDGPEYFGLYTVVEVVDDTVIEDQFPDDGGNLYKPEGSGASFAAGTFSTSWFEKKSNESAADWSDIEALFDALHAGTRTSDPDAWRAGLEAALEVDVFLNWLAVNTVIQNWDTYGLMTHNYYLYNDPASGRLNWIPWDNNEALQVGKMGGALPLDFEGVGSRWPLISYLYDDDVYRARYVTFVETVIEGAFAPARMVPIYQAAGSLIAPYVTGADGERDGYTFLTSPAAFEAELAYLDAHVGDRTDLAAAYVAEQR